MRRKSFGILIGAVVAFLILSALGFAPRPAAGAFGDVIDNFASPGSSPMGLAWEGIYLWNADYGTDNIYKLDPRPRTVISSFDSPESQPTGLAWDGTYLWNADYGTDKIYKLNPTTGAVVSSFGSPDINPRGLTWDGTYLWNADDWTKQIYKLDPTTGDIVDNFASPGSYPRGLAWDGTYLWNVDMVNNRIYKLNPTTGAVVSSIVSPGNQSKGLAWDGTYLWCADLVKIYKLDPTTGDIVDNFASPGSFPMGLAWDGDNLWNVDHDTDNIYKLSATPRAVISSFDSPGSQPTGLAWDGTYIWNADYGTDKIYKLDTSGTPIDNFDSPSSGTTGLAWDGTYLWSADDREGKIYKLSPLDGDLIDEFASPTSDPQGLAWDGTYLWCADRGADKIYKLNPATGNVISSFDSPGSNPTGLAWDGENLWNADYATDKIYKIEVPNQAPTLSGGSVTPASGAWGTTFTYKVTYTDADGDSPASGHPKVYIDGVGKQMVENDQTDTDVTDGKVYKYDWIPASAEVGGHKFYFYVEVITGSAPSPFVVTYDGPTVSKHSTSLTCNVDNSAPAPSQAITFGGYLKDENGAVLYKKTVTLYKEGSSTGLTDITNMSGYYSISTTASSTPGVVDNYTTQFGGDTEYYSSESSQVSVAVGGVNQPPTLSSGSVSPESGVVGTDFVFGVTYKDADGDAPSYIKVYIDGTGHDMTKTSGDYATGATYQYSWATTSGDVGSHDYYFEASDGTNTARDPAADNYAGPSVTEVGQHAPTLTAGSVSPTSGTAGASFTYEVTYADNDDNTPSYVKVYIDGVEHSMSFVSGTYTAGALYRYTWTTTSADVGSHNYYFEASDGTYTARLPTSGTSSGPTISAVVQTYKISGYVKSEGAAVAGATVAVDGQSTTTDANGYYEISGFGGNQSYTLTVSVTGYSTYSGTVSVGTADKELADINLTKAGAPGLPLVAIVVVVIVIVAGVLIVLFKLRKK